MSIDKDFITILDLVTTGQFGDEEKNIVLNKIAKWIEELNSEPALQEDENTKWERYLNEYETANFIYPHLEKYSPEIFKIKDNYYLSSSYKGLLNKFKSINNKELSIKNIDNIIENLIYDFESQEKIYEKDNFRNNLIIECNGDVDEANRLFKKQEEIFSENMNLLSLLSNLIIHKESYDISNETQKVAISLCKQNILKAIESNNKKIVDTEYQIKINDFTTTTHDGKNTPDVLKDLNLYVDSLFDETDKDILIVLIVANILGIIGIFLTINNNLLSTILIVLLLLINVIFFIKLARRSSRRNQTKAKIKEENMNILERILAEAIDYHNILEENQKNYTLLKTYIDNLSTINFIKNNNERNINIGV